MKKQKFAIGQMVIKDDNVCKITKIIQYFDKGICIGYEYFYSFGNKEKVSIGYDLESIEDDLTKLVRIERTRLSTGSYLTI
jgi:hypothetical protein